MNTILEVINDLIITIFFVLVIPSPKTMKSSLDVVIGEASLLWFFYECLTSETTISADQTNSDKVKTLIDEVSFSKTDRTSELYNLINDSTLNVTNVAIWSLLFQKNKRSQKIEKWMEQFEKMIIN